MIAEKFYTLLPDVISAGHVAMNFYTGGFDTEIKADLTPVTEADLAVDSIILAALSEKFPGIPVITEERPSNHGLGNISDEFFLVDPIDGTREFIAGTGEFTINIALISDGIPVAGIVYAPAVNRLFLGTQSGGAFEISDNGERRNISIRQCSDAERIAVASKSHLTDETRNFLSANRLHQVANSGSSLKFCLLAAGEADIYPRFGPTMEWDTAAGHAILAAAGGMVVVGDRSPLRYGKPEFRNPDFVACTPTVEFTFVS